MAAVLAGPRCEGCGKFADKALRCSRCLDIFYCSVECQRAHWPEHKRGCDDASAAECYVCMEKGREKRIRTGCMCRPDGIRARAHPSCIAEAARVRAKGHAGPGYVDWTVCAVCARSMNGPMRGHLLDSWKEHMDRKKIMCYPLQSAWVLDRVSRLEPTKTALTDMQQVLSISAPPNDTRRLLVASIGLYQMAAMCMVENSRKALPRIIKQYSDMVDRIAGEGTHTYHHLALYMAEAIDNAYFGDKARLGTIVEDMLKVVADPEKERVCDAVRLNVHTLEAFSGLKDKALEGYKALLAEKERRGVTGTLVSRALRANIRVVEGPGWADHRLYWLVVA